jgi:hypothetical protein
MASTELSISLLRSDTVHSGREEKHATFFFFFADLKEDFFFPRRGSSRYLRNVGANVPNYKASHSKRPR